MSHAEKCPTCENVPDKMLDCPGCDGKGWVTVEDGRRQEFGELWGMTDPPVLLDRWPIRPPRINCYDATLTSAGPQPSTGGYEVRA